MSKAFVILPALALLSACSWIGRQADALGEHMPVIGERCEHWQCFTSEGKAISAANRNEKEEDAPTQDIKEDTKSRDASPSPAK